MSLQIELAAGLREHNPQISNPLFLCTFHFLGNANCESCVGSSLPQRLKKTDRLRSFHLYHVHSLDCMQTCVMLSFAFRFDICQAKVRAISRPRPVTVLFYCLDPIYPGLPHVAALDVEGFLTNSASTRQYLLHSAPTALVQLAVDTETFPFYPDPPCPAAAAAAVVAKGSSDDGVNDHEHDAPTSKGKCHGRVVYVGASLLEYKEMLAWMLREAAPYGLDIYGSGWQDVPEFSAYWRGVLPQEDLVSLGA